MAHWVRALCADVPVHCGLVLKVCYLALTACKRLETLRVPLLIEDEGAPLASFAIYPGASIRACPGVKSYNNNS